MVVIGTFAWKSLTIMRRIPRKDALLIVLVTAITVMTDLAIAVIVGVILSALFYAWNAATRMHAVSGIDVSGAKIYSLGGPLFFGSTESFLSQFTPKEDPDRVVIDFINSRVVDHSGLQAIESLAKRYDELGKRLQLRHLSRDCQGPSRQGGPACGRARRRSRLWHCHRLRSQDRAGRDRALDRSANGPGRSAVLGSHHDRRFRSTDESFDGSPTDRACVRTMTTKNLQSNREV